MADITADHRISFSVNDTKEIDSQLERGIGQLLERAQQLGDRGILVTRHSPRDFTVELHESVPYGVTQELRLW